MKRSRVVIGAALSLAAPLVTGCGLGVLSRDNPDANQALTACDPSNLPAGCAGICSQAQAILKNSCESCHGVNTLGGLGGITNYYSLSNVPASAQFPGWVYVRPGDPDHSLLYYRAAVVDDMPPPSADAQAPQLPRPSAGDDEVLRQWIQTCIPDVPNDGDFAPIINCPADPPAGSCSISGMTCPYSTQTCACTDGSWSCQPCPSTQPATGSACPTATGNTGNAAPFRCGYGPVTCSCMADRTSVNPPAWACGVCPTSAPSPGQSCGNTALSCAYADQFCNCGAGGWDCSEPICPSVMPGSSRPNLCQGFYACNYPRIDQSCVCKTPVQSITDEFAELACSCPTNPPTTGASCVPSQMPCSYGDQTCLCASALWECQQACPTTAPADGSSCSSSLNCSYGAQLCYCASNVWHCG